MKQISMRIFGTPEYQDILDIMAPSDALVKKFWYECHKAGYN